MGPLVQVTDNIFTVSGLLGAEECRDWIELGESRGFEPAAINTDFGQKRIEDIRNNDRVIMDDEDRAAELWKRIDGKVPTVVPGWGPIGLNERLRFYRYDIGQKFRWHGDGVVRRDNGEKSFLTFLIYLNDNFVGGDTCFRGNVIIEPKQGMLLLFSHWLKHMGNEIDSGRKYVLRSDVMYSKSLN